MNRKIHLIGNAHLDPVWLWRWQEGFAEIKATFRSALDRMNEFPEFIFTSACAAYYQWVEENAPLMFEEIKVRVKEGRWVIVGGWWIQPDCNIPCGESFVRHSLYSQRYFQEKFGVMAKVGYNVDSFGHNGMLPQILKKSGLNYYVFMRPGEYEKQLPGNLFWWESPDKSRVLAYRIPFHYGTGYDGVDVVEQDLNQYGNKFKDDSQHMLFYGVGNHGGGPTISNLLEIRELQEKSSDNMIIHSSPDQFFDSLDLSDQTVPVVKDDLQHHASGCYSTTSIIKKMNRMAEHRLMDAEKYMTLSNRLADYPYAGETIQKAWQNVLFNQFHDIMGGCSIKEAYDDATEFYGESLKIGAEITNGALQRISWSVDTSKGMEKVKLSKETDWAMWENSDLGVPVVLFNPLSWPVQVPIQVRADVKGVTDFDDHPVIHQQVRASRTNGAHDNRDTLFIADLPALGYSTYWVYKNKTFSNKVQAMGLRTQVVKDQEDQSESIVVQNNFIKLEIDCHSGTIKNLFDKQFNKKIFDGRAAVPIVVDETNADTWAHGIFSFRDEVGKFSNATVKIIEDGPIRTVIRAKSSYHHSEIRQDYIVYSHKKDIEVKVQLNWQEKHRMLKLSFPVNVQDPVVTYEIPYGSMNRPANGEEEPGQQWVDIYGDNYGLALLNDCKYSFDVKDNDMRMTVVRGAIYADHYGVRDDLCEYMDQGIQEFKYALVPHTGSWKQPENHIVKKAMEFNTIFPNFIETYHKGHLPQSYSGIRISKENIVATVLKRCEDQTGFILRCYEPLGQGTEVTIDLPILVRKWTTSFAANEIKTLFIPDDQLSQVEETNLLEVLGSI